MCILTDIYVLNGDGGGGGGDSGNGSGSKKQNKKKKYSSYLAHFIRFISPD